MKKSGVFSQIFKDEIYYIGILFLLSALNLKYSIVMSLALCVVIAAMFIHMYLRRKKRLHSVSEYIESLTFDMDNVSKRLLFNVPFPMVILRPDGSIVWNNSLMGEVTGKEDMFEENISDYIKDMDKIIKGHSENASLYDIKINGKFYNVKINKVKEDSLLIIYFIDVTDYEKLKEEYLQKHIVSMLITVDNYDEVMQNADEAQRPQIAAKLDTIITHYITEAGGVIKKLEKDKYSAQIFKSALNNFEKNKFQILEEIREAAKEGKMPPTLSIGIGEGGQTPYECDQFASAALDMALGRGGDQVVIKHLGGFRYFGGKTKEVEKRTRVKARVMAHALRELIRQYENIIIMGHKHIDADALGSAVGIAAAVRIRGKNAKIVLGTYDETAKRMLQRFDKSALHQKLFITKQDAIDMANDKTLVIICDTHKESLVECPEILSTCGAIVVIDHHRRSADFIENTALLYHETYASSTSEMVTEIIQYIDEKFSLTSLEAEALYLGIMVDTKNFVFKTGTRTFEAAAYLKRMGADTISVKQMTQSDIKDFVTRAEIIKSAQIYKENIAIAKTSDVDSVIVAQAADELLNISGIEASFVLTESPQGVNISGRSLGNINVQMILERLGGGGHMTVAGAQIENESINTVFEKLKEAIDDYFTQSQ